MKELYLEILRNKIKETEYNMQQAEKKAKQFRAEYLAVVREKEAFEKGMGEIINED